MKVLRILTVALVALVVAVGTGCGGGDDNEKPAEPTKTTGTTEKGGAETRTVSMDEYSFSPKDVTVKRGSTISVDNKGGIAHNLTVEQGPDPKKESKKLAGTPTFTGGSSEKLKVDLKPGKYAMVCTVPGHRELGMTGSFTVK